MALCSLFGSIGPTMAFAPAALKPHDVHIAHPASTSTWSALHGHPGEPSGGGAATVEATGFIDTELRGAAMRLHTFSQAPKEGRVQEAERKPYTPTRMDYLRFLVDSQAVYRAFEEVVHELPEMGAFCDSGLERVDVLEEDIEYMVKEYGLTRPEVGSVGNEYAREVRKMAKESKVPELVCHYYNHFFAHTAGEYPVESSLLHYAAFIST